MRKRHWLLIALLIPVVYILGGLTATWMLNPGLRPQWPRWRWTTRAPQRREIEAALNLWATNPVPDGAWFLKFLRDAGWLKDFMPEQGWPATCPHLDLNEPLVYPVELEYRRFSVPDDALYCFRVRRPAEGAPFELIAIEKRDMEGRLIDCDLPMPTVEQTAEANEVVQRIFKPAPAVQQKMVDQIMDDIEKNAR